MERNPQKISAVMGDPTRYRIYQHVLIAQAPVTAADVAEQVGLHPNVARMHLGKLVDIGLVIATSEKTGKGGRPGYLYAPSGQAVSLNVPARDFQLLADLLVQSLELLGDGARDAIGQIGRSFGRRLGHEALEVNGPQEQEDLIRTCAGALHRLGVMTHVTHGPEGSVTLVLKTCGFREVAVTHPDQVCHLCKAMVEGITQACLEAVPTVTQASSLPRGDKECVYELGGLSWSQK